MIKKIINIIRNNNNVIYDRILYNQGIILTNENKRKHQIHDLAEVEVSIFSQWGEDGIIDWLISNCALPTKTFIEFGVEDYKESNTRFLLMKRNWDGAIIESSKKCIQKIKEDEISWKYNLIVKNVFLDKDNINAVINDLCKDNELGILSIDIDGNDYWLWESIENVKPYIVIIEYNSLFGDIVSVSIPYNSTFVRNKCNNQYYGASVMALKNLGAKKGYSLLGTNSSGVNAFFIRNDIKHEVFSKIKEINIYPSKFRDEKDEGGKFTFRSNEQRYDSIKQMKYVNVETTRKVCQLGEIHSTHSPNWMEGKPRCI